MLALRTNFTKKKYKLMWHNMIKYKINSSFEKPNHVMASNATSPSCVPPRVM